MRATLSAPATVTTSATTTPSRSAVLVRFADYVELTKPKIATMALVAAAVGYALGSAGNWQPLPLWYALFGISLVAAGSSALNQYLERAIDARMIRTCNRPLPAGRLGAGEVLVFAVATGVGGTLFLAWMVNMTTAILGAATLVLYAFVYTPLKRVTSFNTAVGAIPGALPPVLGWTAAGGTLDQGAFALFAILFLWQFPHFMAIAWLYRDDYARAGLKMLPIRDVSERTTGLLAVGYAATLLPISLLPSQFGLAGNGYAVSALVLGAGYLISALRFERRQSVANARGLLWTSLVYLPSLLLVLLGDHYRLLS